MARRRVRAQSAPELDFDAIRGEAGVPGPFSSEVLAAADAAARTPRVAVRDATAIDFVTIDPPGSRDLDQAVALEERRGGGWRVHYAIADVAAWVSAGGLLDAEARRRTQTFYAPDRRTPLHPPVLGDGAASLLPDGPRPAALWTIDVRPDGTTAAVELGRAMVRSRAQLTYAEVQADLDAGRARETLRSLPAIGEALLADARARNAIELELPDQEVVESPGGGWALELRADLSVERWNAQISLLTGRAAARLMLDAGVGVLRTLPAPDPAELPPLRRVALALGVEWAEGVGLGGVLAALDPFRPRHAAFADEAAELLRGAGYTSFDGTAPADAGHAGVGGPYAHVTAPLRRLVDRFATEICLAVASGEDAPEWAVEALPSLPDAMADGDRRSSKLERAVIDATEAFVLRDRIGEVFPATVMETGDRYGTVVLEEPAVRARCDARDLPLGAEIHVRCVEADVRARTVRFERAS